MRPGDLVGPFDLLNAGDGDVPLFFNPKTKREVWETNWSSWREDWYVRPDLQDKTTNKQIREAFYTNERQAVSRWCGMATNIMQLRTAADFGDREQFFYGLKAMHATLFYNLYEQNLHRFNAFNILITNKILSGFCRRLRVQGLASEEETDEIKKLYHIRRSNWTKYERVGEYSRWREDIKVYGKNGNTGYPDYPRDHPEFWMG